jgi:hypothetical protein
MVSHHCKKKIQQRQKLQFTKRFFTCAIAPAFWYGHLNSYNLTIRNILSYYHHRQRKLCVPWTSDEQSEFLFIIAKIEFY